MEEITETTPVKQGKEAIMVNNRKELMQQASVMYYEMGYSQNKIAEILDISRSYVSQLLILSRQTGIVQIIIKNDDTTLRMIKSEIDFKKVFPKVRKVYIMRSESIEFSETNLPNFAATYVTDMIQDANVIGVNLGYSVVKTIESLNIDDFRDCENKKVVQIMGGFHSNLIGSGNPNDVVLSLANILRCRSYYLNCPAIIEQSDLLAALKKEQTIKAVIDMWESIDLAIMGVGTVDNTSRMYGAFDEETKNAITEKSIKAEATLNFFDKDGRVIPLLSDRKIAIDYSSLKKIRTKAFICRGINKKEAILSLLKANIIDVLIIDSITADAIMSDYISK